MLKKVIKDLTLHPIPLALKWDHISDLEIADPELRTPARIDLLMGAEVFASILRDGRRTRPRGTPSAINTCLGWVLFGKIQDSNVANYTLEQDELKYSRRQKKRSRFVIVVRSYYVRTTATLQCER